MSFLRTIEIINKIPLMMYRKILNYKHIFDIRRKEEGFDFLPDLIAISCVKEKASVSASVTVEAVLCVPLFLYAVVSLIWILELRSIQSAVRCGLQSAGKQVAESFAEIPKLLSKVTPSLHVLPSDCGFSAPTHLQHQRFPEDHS